MLIDIAAWALAIVIAQVLRLDFDVSQVVGWSTAALIGFVAGPWVGVPRSAIPVAAPISLLVMAAARYALRLSDEAVGRPTATRKAIIFGAGYIGSSLVRRLLTDSRSPYVVAIARADSQLMQRVSEVAAPLGLTVKVVPALDQMLSRGSASVSLRDLSIEDIVGRRPVDTDVASIAEYLTGKRVLITGAGGSIGLELCRQVHRFGPAELIMLDRDETGLQAAELLVYGHGLLHGYRGGAG